MIELLFASDYAEYLLLANGIAVIFYLASKKKKKQRAMKFGNYETLQKVAGKNFLKSSNFILVTKILALTSLIIGLSSPVIVQEVTSPNTEYVLAIDKSPNMLVDDVEPSRLDAAKDSALNFIDILENRTEVGAISFSGNVDINAGMEEQNVAKGIRNIEAGSTAETSMAQAIYTGTSLLMNRSSASKSLIIISAGRDTSGGINDSVKFAKENNITINTIGVGDSEASQTDNFEVIEGQNATRAASPEANFTLLESISNSTGGSAVSAGSRSELRDSFLEIERRDKRTDISIFFIGLGTFLVLIEWVLGTTRYSILP